MNDGLHIRLEWDSDTFFYLCFLCFDKFRQIENNSKNNHCYRDYNNTNF